MSKVYFNQADPRWASHPYTAPAYPNATVKSAGCGPTCGAMIVSSTKELIYPDEMCDISKANGYRVNGGTSDNFFYYLCERWGFEIERIHSSYEAHERCKNGWFVVMCCGEGLWTSGGHFILAVGAKDDKIEIYDPYLYSGKFNTASRRGKVEMVGNSAWVQIDTFKANSNVQRLYAINVGKAVTDSTSASEELKDGKVMYVNTQSLPLNVRSGPSSSASVVGSLPKGTQVLVYATQDGWSKIGTNKWVSSQYLSEAKPNSGTPATTVVTTTTGTVTANKGLNVRSGPSTSYGVVRALTKGTQVTIYEEQNGWGRIGNNEWVSMDYISKSTSTSTVPVSTKTMYVKVNSSLNVRSGPSTNHKVVGSLTNGTEVTVYEEQNGWARIGDNQWVSAQYLTSSGTSIPSTVGRTVKFKGTTYLYSNPNLTGTKYTYLPNTRATILQNVSSTVDKVNIPATGRTAYVNNSAY